MPFQNGPRGNPPPRPAPPPRPQVGIGRYIQAPSPRIAPAPPTAPHPAPSHFLGAVGGAISHSAPAVHNAVQQATTPHKAGAGPHNAFTGTPEYKQAVAQVFRSQPPAMKAAVIQGITRSNAFNSPEYQAVRNQWDHLSLPERSTIGNLIPKDLPKFIAPKPGPDILGGIGHALGAGIHALESSAGLLPFQRDQQPGTPPAEKVLAGLGQGASSLIDKIPTGIGMPTEQRGILKQQGLTPGELGKNFAKDLVNLPAQALPSVATPVQDVLTGHPKKALQESLGQYAQIAQHPLQMAAQHPLDTALAVTGLVHGAARAAAAPVRAIAPEGSVVGRALSTKREGVALTGKLTYEQPRYSKSPTIKAQQKSIERQRFVRSPTGALVPKDQALRDKLIRKGVGQLVSLRERVRRVNREAVRVQRESSVRPSTPGLAAHGVKTVLAYDPARPAIKGAGVLSRVADLTVRRPDTFAQDLQKHLDQISANRHNLLDNPDLLKEHDANVKEIRQAIKHPPSPKQMKALFDAAEKYRTDYGVTQAQAHGLGHFGDMTAAELQRRELAHYAATHMDGVKYNNDLGIVRDASRNEVRAFRSGLIAKADKLESQGAVRKAAVLREQAKAAWDEQVVPVTNQEMLAPLNGPEGTGGRLPAYTPDYPRSGSAYYISSERRPLPATAKNTLFAYTHGLTDPSHEALTERHVQLQGVVDSHHAQNEYLDTLAHTKQDGSYWKSYQEAKSELPRGYVPINVSHPFHPQEPLDKAMQGVDPTLMEEEAARRSLHFDERLRPDSPGGRWAGIDEFAVRALREQQGMVSPNATMRVIRGLNTQFRTVALGTSAKHIPGVATENLIRDISYGVGVRSWLTGHRISGVWKRDLGPAGAREMRARTTGGQVAGMTDFARTYSTSEHYRGTTLYKPLKAWEVFRKNPGVRQLRTAWMAWSKLVIDGTKHALEEQHQIAAMGKTALGEHGYVQAAKSHGFVGAVQRLLALHGKMLEDAARGLYDPAKQRQYRAEANRVYGTWTDLTPSGKTAVMFSPFGMWWVNSVKFLARAPIDQPIKTSLLAATNMGTSQQLHNEGLDTFESLGGDKSQLPPYEQGGIPVGGKILAQNYYSPFGVINNPLETSASLIQPWALPVLQGAGGVDYLWKPLTAPGQNTNKGNEKTPTPGQRIQYVMGSLFASFVPLYTKAQQLAEGGSSPYDVSGSSPIPNPLAPATKTPGQGMGAGAKKAFMPVRMYRKGGGSSSSSTSSSSGWGGSSRSGSGSSSSSGWGASSGGSSSSGWG